MPLVVSAIAWEDAAGLAVAVFLLGYLLHALVRAERF